MLGAKRYKKELQNLGADLCGIASIDRFNDAPIGFHPQDVLPACKSVIVFGKRFPAGTLHCKTNIPYTIARNILTSTLDTMAVEFCSRMEQEGIAAIPTAAASYTQYDPNTHRWRGMVSTKHAAQAAGLGRIGRNSLLVTPEYGNMVWLSTILTDAELEPDPVLPGSPCADTCTICIDNCPVNALGGAAVDQAACYPHSYRINEQGALEIHCHNCRTRCPHCLGSENQQMRR